jgi:hypothetical protein
MGPKRYGLVLAALLVIAQMVVAPVAAEICFSKVCDSNAARLGLCVMCCSGHGTCIGYNQCQCDFGYYGKECTDHEYCGFNSSRKAQCLYSCSASLTGDKTGMCGPGNLTPWPYPGSTSIIYYDDFNLSNETCFCSDGMIGTCCDQYRLGTLSPSALNFSSITVGEVAAAQANITYFTPLTRSNMTVETIALGGANAGDFALGSGTCAANTNVTAGGNCTIPVSFTPIATGTRSATLTITTQEPDGTNPQTLTTSLTGTGITTVSSILIDPITPANVFAGLDGAGIYYSADSGGSWSIASLSPVNTRIKALAITPGDSTKLFAATYGGGVYKSTDSGASWSACANTGLTNTNVLSLVISPAKTLYAGTEAGVFTSTDNCNSWAAQNTGLP